MPNVTIPCLPSKNATGNHNNATASPLGAKQSSLPSGFGEGFGGGVGGNMNMNNNFGVRSSNVQHQHQHHQAQQMHVRPPQQFCQASAAHLNNNFENNINNHINHNNLNENDNHLGEGDDEEDDRHTLHSNSGQKKSSPAKQEIRNNPRPVPNHSPCSEEYEGGEGITGACASGGDGGNNLLNYDSSNPNNNNNNNNNNFENTADDDGHFIEDTVDYNPRNIHKNRVKNHLSQLVMSEKKKNCDKKPQVFSRNNDDNNDTNENQSGQPLSLPHFMSVFDRTQIHSYSQNNSVSVQNFNPAINDHDSESQDDNPPANHDNDSPAPVTDILSNAHSVKSGNVHYMSGSGEYNNMNGGHKKNNTNNNKRPRPIRGKRYRNSKFSMGFNTKTITKGLVRHFFQRSALISDACKLLHF